MTEFTGTDVLNAIASASKGLSDRKDEINRLNVFPVPDGDTGTNMSLTLESVVKNLSALQLGAGSVLRRRHTDGGLHDVLGQIQLAGQRALFHDAVGQRAHPLQERARQGAAHHDPQHAGFLVHVQRHAP